MKNEKGFTLVEILASMVILFIVLISFFGFFTQSALFTRINQDSLQATNLAEEVMAVLRGKKEDEINTLISGAGANIDQLRAELGVNNSNQFIENNSLQLRITNLGASDGIQLVQVKIEIIHTERDSVLATRYFWVEASIGEDADGNDNST